MCVCDDRQGLGTLQRTLERINRDLESKIVCASLDNECIEVNIQNEGVNDVYNTPLNTIPNVVISWYIHVCILYIFRCVSATLWGV